MQGGTNKDGVAYQEKKKECKRKGASGKSNNPKVERAQSQLGLLSLISLMSLKV